MEINSMDEQDSKEKKYFETPKIDFVTFEKVTERYGKSFYKEI